MISRALKGNRVGAGVIVRTFVGIRVGVRDEKTLLPVGVKVGNAVQSSVRAGASGTASKD